ncbi:RagB/SusD family nutrient uptake outer membrane protein [Olivibacter sp. SDN3]|uniref:RagB/SusD family nutrient uptake outer membrane protein n=1 Tax=Olivibacter sp. SDN3 TaxID=2764720 RepID=UPI001651964F|nr:RagB/SusD family nutrient uptake outer membrane protein [Olivibacter sp. SDN3]QNL51227.1 RagB/SusD family nutrient uptake outer membrane protein [Olivibacter sp. SDN3]
MKTLNILKQSWPVVILLLTTVIITSCKKDFLDRKPLGEYIEEDIPPGDLNAQVYAIYAALREDGISSLPYIAVHNIRSDDADKGSTVSDGADAEAIFDNFQYTTDFWLINQYWSDHYNLIAMANNVIDAVDSVGLESEVTRVNLGEAKFFRAYAYFDMVRAFGEVPLIDFRILRQEDAIKPKATVADIYGLIDEDLEEAIAYLPTNWDPSFIGRVTKGSALTLRTKSYMARQMYGQALSTARMVMESGEYNLNMSYEQIFRESGENGSESIFEIQALYTQNQTDVGLNYASRQGVRGGGVWDLGWGWNTPNERLAAAFEEGDPRKDETLLYSGQINTPYGEEVPAATSELPRPYWSKKVYTDPAIRRSAGSLQGQWFNMRVYRYADLVLLAAEAANETGDRVSALNYLETVRARARGNNEEVLPEVTAEDQVELREAIRHERQVELGMENERFFDLVRWGIDIEVMHEAGKTGYQERHRYLPIPQPEIDRSGGVLVQNPNY